MVSMSWNETFILLVGFGQVWDDGLVLMISVASGVVHILNRFDQVPSFETSSALYLYNSGFNSKTQERCDIWGH